MFKKFIRKFNRKAKTIDFSQPFFIFRENLGELVEII